MNLKTYRAPSMAQALSEVKKDFGKDAVILHTRVHKVGAVMGIGGRQVVEITAADRMVASGPGIKSAGETLFTRLGDGSLAAKRQGSSEQFIAEAFANVEGPAAAGETPMVSVRPVKLESLRSGLEEELPPHATGARGGSGPLSGAPSGASFQAPPLARPDLATKVAFAPVNGEAVEAMNSELASIKRLLGQVLHCSRQTAASVSPAATGVVNMGGLSDPLFAIYLKLQDAQVAPAITETLIGKVRDELTPDELASPDVVRQAVLRHLALLVPVVGHVSKAGQGEGGRPLTIALVGPTGVGKTTTIAKLAAAYKLRHGKEVGLITSDTYRIAAVDQLRTYANIIGLPLKVVMTPREMASACGELASCDVILIDTAGRSQHDANRLGELAEFIEACSPDETHLVLSATMAEPVLMKAAERFGALGPTRIIFSKLDEAVQFGSLINLMHGSRLKVSYVTTGQEVPDQIELAQADRLVRSVLDGELAR